MSNRVESLTLIDNRDIVTARKRNTAEPVVAYFEHPA
jgi:hypothetical protein